MSKKFRVTDSLGGEYTIPADTYMIDEGELHFGADDRPVAAFSSGHWVSVFEIMEVTK